MHRPVATELDYRGTTKRRAANRSP